MSNTLDSSFFVDALEEAIDNFGQPEIFNTDQGAQFTGEQENLAGSVAQAPLAQG